MKARKSYVGKRPCDPMEAGFGVVKGPNIKGAAAKVSNCEGYIRNLQYYLRHGDYCDDRYGAFQEKRIKWQTIVPKG